ncbi:MAG: hypothetical protein B6U69_01370 [Thermofilum sp. ex4484_15]|nr:MAG: hypothetical protein B6U69_01370 [Thermofilum sp. ex4484_15]
MKLNRKLVLALLSVGILSFMAFMIIVGVDINKVIKLLGTLDLRYVSLALLFDVTFILLYATSWYFLVKVILVNLKLRDSLIAVTMGWLGDMMVPAAFTTGEAIRLYYLKKVYDLDYSKSLATVVVQRLLGSLAFASYLLMGLMYVWLKGLTVAKPLYKEAFLFAFASLSLVALGFLTIIRIGTFNRLVDFLCDKLLNILSKTKFKKYAASLTEGALSLKKSMAIIRERRSYMAIAFALLLLHWSAGIMIPYCYFKALGHPVSFWLLSLAYPIYGAVDNIPLGIPVNAGLLDIAMSATFMLLGISKEIAVTATLLTRLTTVVFETITTGSVSLLFGLRKILREGVTLEGDNA